MLPHQNAMSSAVSRSTPMSGSFVHTGFVRDHVDAMNVEIGAVACEGFVVEEPLISIDDDVRPTSKVVCSEAVADEDEVDAVGGITVVENGLHVRRTREIWMRPTRRVAGLRVRSHRA